MNIKEDIYLKVFYFFFSSFSKRKIFANEMEFNKQISIPLTGLQFEEKL